MHRFPSQPGGNSLAAVELSRLCPYPTLATLHHDRNERVNPHLPEWASELTLRGMRIANSRVSLHFTRTGQGCFAAVTETQGDPLALRIEVGAGNPAS